MGTEVTTNIIEGINKYKFIFNNDENLSFEIEGNNLAFFASFLPMIITTELNYYFENTDFCKFYEGVDNLTDSQLLQLSEKINQLTENTQINYISIYIFNNNLNKYEKIYNSNINMLRTTITNQKHFKLESNEQLNDVINDAFFLISMICNRE